MRNFEQEIIAAIENSLDGLTKSEIYRKVRPALGDYHFDNTLWEMCEQGKVLVVQRWKNGKKSQGRFKNIFKLPSKAEE